MSCPISYLNCLRATIHGQIGNFIPIIGQMAGQSISISKAYKIPPSVSSFIVLFERGMMFVSGSLLCGVSLLTLFYEWISQQFPSWGGLIDLLIILTLCSSLSLLSLNDKNRAIFRKYFSLRSITYSLLVFLSSLVSWFFVSSAFVILLVFMGATVPWVFLFGISVLVCFIASLPLSTSGWGVRELAAMTLFGLLNIPQETALFISISIGIISLVALVVSALGLFY